MQMRQATLLASKSVTSAVPEIIDIDDVDPMSQIVIRMKGTNDGSTPTAHPATMMTKIELIDGSDVLMSLNGEEAQALNCYENGVQPFSVLEYEDNVQCCAVMNLNFGEFLGDTKHAFDPNRYKNPQLKLTQTPASGGSACDAGTLQVTAKTFDEKKISPMGFLSSKRLLSYALSSSAHEYIDLPQDYPIRKLLVMSTANEKSITDQYNKIRLYEDNGKKVPIDETSTSELIKMYGPNKKFTERFAGLGSGSAVDHYTLTYYETESTAVGRSASQSTLIVSQAAGNRIEVTNDSSESFLARSSGYAPHGAIELMELCGMSDSDYYDTMSKGSVKLDITAGSSVGSSSTCEVVTQQLRRY